MISRSIAVVCALLMFVSLARAQVTVEVVDGNGRPIAAASVQLWGVAQLLGEKNLDSRGRVTLTSEELLSSTSISAQHLGYQSAVQRIRQPVPTTIRLVLIPAPLELPAVIASTKKLCPGKDDQSARAIWKGMAQRYTPIADQNFITTAYYLFESITSVDSIGIFPMRQSPFAARSLRKPNDGLAEVNIEREGYARRTSSGFGGEFDSWEYAHVGSLQAEHFASDLFAARHRIRVMNKTDESIQLAFCPATTKGGEIEGTLTLRADSSLSVVNWRYVVPRDDEDAGGRSVFPPASGKGPLLPTSTLFWRQHRFQGQYYQRLERYGIWSVGGVEDNRRVIREWKQRFDPNTRAN